MNNDNNKLSIHICMGSSCFARGNNEYLEYLERIIAKNKLEDAIDLYGDRCSSMCHIGPSIKIDDEACEKVDIESIKEVLKIHFPDIDLEV